MTDLPGINAADAAGLEAILAHRNKREEAVFAIYFDRVSKLGKERKVLLLTKHRVLVLKPAESGKKPSPPKIETDLHLLDITRIESPSEQRFKLDGQRGDITGESPQADEVITTVRRIYLTAFADVDERQVIQYAVVPESRLVNLGKQAGSTVCNGFSQTYAAICDFQGILHNQGICWDVDNVIAKQRISTLNLKEFDGLAHPGNMRALFTALRYNSYFKSFKANDVPIPKDAYIALFDMLRHNTSFTEVSLGNCGIPGDAWGPIGDALSANTAGAIAHLDCSNNPITDKFVASLANFVSRAHNGLISLDLSYTGLGKAGVGAIANALKKNAKMSQTLAHLNFSHNKLESDGSSALAAFLAGPNALRTLNIADTSASLDLVTSALTRGSQELTKLDFSGNRIDKKVSGAMVLLLQAAGKMKELNIASSQIPADALKDVLQGIHKNVYLQGLFVNASENMLGIAGAKMLTSLAEKSLSLTAFDLSGNDFGDEGVAILAEGLCSNTSLRSLNLDRCFRSGKSTPQTRRLAIDALINLITPSTSVCPLETLSLAGGKGAQLKDDLIDFIYAVGVNETLTSLDISGHGMGSSGAINLAKAVQTNAVLTRLHWDRNDTSLNGLEVFAAGLQRNHTLKHMPSPIFDIAAMITGKDQALEEKVQKVASEIEKIIGRNQSPSSKYAATAEYLGGQTLLSISAQQADLEKQLLKVKGFGKAGYDQSVVDVMSDAAKFDNATTNLYSLKDAVHHDCIVEFNNKLKSLITEQIQPIFTSSKQLLVSRIIQIVKENCQSFDETTLRRLQTSVDFGARDVSKETLEGIMMEAAGQELSAKASECFASATDIAMDYLFEKLNDSLQQTIDELQAESDRERLGIPSATGTLPRESSYEQVSSTIGGSKADEKKKGSHLSIKSPLKLGSKEKEKEKEKDKKDDKKPDASPAVVPARKALPTVPTPAAAAPSAPGAASAPGKAVAAKPMPAVPTPSSPVPSVPKRTSNTAAVPGKPVAGPAAASGDSDDSALDDLEKKEGNLEHLTKSRAAGAKRRPPTRRPRVQE